MPGGIEFREVARRVSCRDVLEAEGLEIHGDRAKCPFHGGTHYNLKLFDDGRCYCHQCHRAGDAVQLASALWHVEQTTAAARLNQQFGLGLGLSEPSAERVHVLSERERRRQKAEAALAAAVAEARAAWDQVEQTEANTPERAEAERLAKNADDWLNFKRFEAIQAGVTIA